MKVYSWGNLLLSELVGGGPKTGCGVFRPRIEKHFLRPRFLEGEYEPHSKRPIILKMRKNKANLVEKDGTYACRAVHIPVSYREYKEIYKPIS